MYRHALRIRTPHIRACYALNARLLSTSPRLEFIHDDYVGSIWSRRAQISTENLAFSGRKINSSLALPLRPLGDTIYALSSGQGRAGLAVIRVSGPHCQDVSLHEQGRERKSDSKHVDKSGRFITPCVPATRICQSQDMQSYGHYRSQVPGRETAPQSLTRRR
jgi:hypothetical protein